MKTGTLTSPMCAIGTNLPALVANNQPPPLNPTNTPPHTNFLRLRSPNVCRPSPRRARLARFFLSRDNASSSPGAGCRPCLSFLLSLPHSATVAFMCSADIAFTKSFPLNKLAMLKPWTPRLCWRTDEFFNAAVRPRRCPCCCTQA